MIKDYLDSDDYNDLEISDPKIAAAIFRDYIKERKENNSKINISEYYNMLSDKKQKIVLHMITCILPKEKREQNLKGYFSELIKDKNIIRENLVDMIDSKIHCGFIRNLVPVDSDRGVIKSKIQNFTKILNPVKDSSYLDDICNLLNVDLDAITTGCGIEYSIDETNLEKLIIKKGYDVETYLQNFVAEYIPCEKCDNNKNYCESKNNYCKYLMHDKKSIAEALSKKLEVPIEDILQCNSIVITTSNLSFEEYYNKLSKHDKRIIYFLIQDLFTLDENLDNMDD